MHFSTLALAVYALTVQAGIIQLPVQQQHAEVAKRDNSPISASLKDEQSFYTTELELGTPKQKFRLLLDTGSSDTWVFSKEDTYDCGYGSCDYTGQFTKNQSSTYSQVDEDFAFYYLNGNAKGKFAKDTLTIGGKETKNFQFGLSDDAFGPDPLTGIAGIGFKDREATKNKYPNLPEALKAAGHINKVAYSLYLNDNSGNIVFGGVDEAKFHGDLVEHKMTDERKIQIDFHEVAVSGTVCSSDDDGATAAQLDTGSTLSYIDDTVLNRVFLKLPVFIGDYLENQGAYKISCMPPQFDVSFTFGDQKLHINGSDLIIPVSRNWSDLDKGCYFGITSNKHSRGQTILGGTFLRSVYAVVDLEDKTVSLAPIKKTDETKLKEL